MLAAYRKAIAAALTSVVGLVALFVPAVHDYATPDVLAAVAMVAGTALVYFVPNKMLVVAFLAIGLAGCAQVDAARRGAESIAAAGPVLGPAIGRVVATCTGPAPELEAAKAALAGAFEVEALSDPAIRAHAMVTALCGVDRAGPAG